MGSLGEGVQFVQLVALLFLFLSHSCRAAPRNHTIDVPNMGYLTGQIHYSWPDEAFEYIRYLGVPYAQPPVGSNRWAPPVALESFPQSPYLALDFPPGCPQMCDHKLPPHTCPNTTSEDCLYLNIFVPVDFLEYLPVMVFFPGGHFEYGTTSTYLYDGSRLALRGQSVIVTVSYRLGFLGWLTTAGGAGNLNGNFGFLDQVEALKWINNYIVYFGGDPKKVTIFGQSAGATSIRAHLISTISVPYYSAAIIQSDPLPIPMRSLEDASNFGKTFTDKLNCNDLPCLRSKTIDEILAAQEAVENAIDYSRPIEAFLPFVPTVDLDLIPLHTMKAFETGQYNKDVPIMIGTTKQDARIFVYQFAVNQTLTDIAYEASLALIFHMKAGLVKAQYPPLGDPQKNLELLSQLATDYIFTCASRHIAQATYNFTQPNKKIFMYQWEYPINASLWGPDFQMCYNEACHASELPFEFGGYDFQASYYQFTEEEYELTSAMIDAVTSFGAWGEPVSSYFRDWAHFKTENQWALLLQLPPIEMSPSGYFDSICSFWDGMGYTYGWQD